MWVYSVLVVLLCVTLRTGLCARETDDFDPYPNKKASNRPIDEIKEEQEIEYWRKTAINVVNDRLSVKVNTNTAKNVILFLGDGMSIPTIAAARVYLGGEEKQLAFDKFPYTALSKTYCVDHQVPDSACSATAYLCGVKGNLGTVGVGPAVPKQNCTLMTNIDNHVDSIARLFQLKGKKSGLVTTTRVTHASPAGVYAHTSTRQWESDSKILEYDEDPSVCRDIAYQLVYGDTGQNLNVVLGGGRQMFLPKEIVDEEGEPGHRSDHISLIEEWKKMKTERKQAYQYIWNRTDLLYNVKNETDYLLGLFASSHMPYNLDRDEEKQPSLAEMTEAAINVLQKGNEGFFLFVEGGHIDLAHHESFARKALDETLEFSKAIEKAIEMTNDRDTLIVVTADHAHTMSVSGHGERGSDIFGYAGVGSDDIPYPILNYANGPGYKPLNKDGKRYVPSIDEMRHSDFRMPSNAPLLFETHGADDVPIYARGPMAHLYRGVMEENVIPHIMAVASCVSNDINCDEINKLA